MYTAGSCVSTRGSSWLNTTSHTLVLSYFLAHHLSHPAGCHCFTLGFTLLQATLPLSGGVEGGGGTRGNWIGFLCCKGAMVSDAVSFRNERKTLT